MTRHSSIHQVYRDIYGRAWVLCPTLAFASEFRQWLGKASDSGADALMIFYVHALWDLCEGQAYDYGLTIEEFSGIVNAEFISFLWMSLAPISSEFSAMSAAYRSAANGCD